MYEIDLLPVGHGKDSGDAIAARFTGADGSTKHVVIDAGYQDTGPALVEHVKKYYGSEARIDVAIVTHPDGDHIGGMGTVLRDLDVSHLLVHRLGDRGGDGLPAADAVEELIEVAESRGTAVHEPFSGMTAFDGMITILGPDEDWYEELVQEQQVEAIGHGGSRGGVLLEAAVALGERVLTALPLEIPFDDGPGTSPRNNTSVITLLEVGDHRMLLTGDAGVPALERAWDWLAANSYSTRAPDFVQVPHHGSRRNASSEMLDRVLGAVGRDERCTAMVSATGSNPKHPAGRTVNAYKRRGYHVYCTQGQAICHASDDAPPRAGWSPIPPLHAMDESLDED